MTSLPNPPILIVTDRAQCNEPLEPRAEALFRGGCRWLSLREKDLPADARLALLSRLMRIGSDFGATIGVHGDEAAAASCRSALHLDAASDPSTARAKLGQGPLLGQSCHSHAELDRANLGDVDYVTLGPPFPSIGKAGYRPSITLEAFFGLAARSTKPVLALGGVGLATVDKLRGANLAGFAAMGEAMRTGDPATWFRALNRVWLSLKGSA